MSDAAPDLRSLELNDLSTILVTEFGERRFRGQQVWRWLHYSRVRRIEDMRNVPATLRERLLEKFPLQNLRVDTVQTSRDGTRKLRLLTHDDRAIETVLIPDGDKLTQCISSQVGCALGCSFCATAKLGLMRHLSAGEIVAQVYLAQDFLAEHEPGRRITNLVYMGMGEPLHNYDQVVKSVRLLTSDFGANLSYRRITVSTVGLVPAIEKLGKEPVRPNLAVSLNASNDLVRDEIMPINRRFNIERLMAAIRAFPLEPRRRVTLEYVLLAGKNDTLEDADRLAGLTRGLRCKINVIPWNPHPGAPFQRPQPKAVEAFQNHLRARGCAVYLRTPRGDDIDAACGQLANRGAVAA